MAWLKCRPEAPGGTRQAGGQAELVAAGVIRTSAQRPTPQRLAKLAAEFDSLIAEYSPDVVALERVFFTANVSTAMGVAQAAGLMMAAGVTSGAQVEEYTPNQVKMAITGWGAAPKDQMQRMIQMLLRLPQILKPADTADAVAVALCHLSHSGPGAIASQVAQAAAQAADQTPAAAQAAVQTPAAAQAAVQTPAGAPR